MNLTVEDDKTLLVEGPAAVTILSGKVTVFGSLVREASRIVIREGKRLPFTVEKTANLDISLGENGRVEKVDGNTIPLTWTRASEILLRCPKKPSIAIVLGGVDSGKTSFCTYLVNEIIDKKRTVAVLDGDLGQSDVGPPCTVAYAFAAKSIAELQELDAENAFFVGVTSPSDEMSRTIKGLISMKEEILKRTVDFVVVNTDGWVEGEKAVEYKTRLVEELKADVIFCIQQGDELKPLLAALQEFSTVLIESPTTVMQRSREKRKSLRELNYIKYLANSKVKSWFLDQLVVEEDNVLGLSQNYWGTKEAEKMCEILKIEPLHLAELSGTLVIVIEKTRSVSSGAIEEAEEITRKKIRLIHQGEEAGLLLGFCDGQKKFLGIGVLREVNYLKRKLKTLTSVSEKPSSIIFGRVWLDGNLREVPALWSEAQNIGQTNS
jgi:polynucleotide 5'-hydroxyl-kinase GRC3/NOL9